MRRLETQRWRTRWPEAELHPDVPAHGYAARRRGWAQLIDGRLHHGEGVGMDPKKGDASGENRDTDEGDEHRASPPDWIIGLMLFEEVDDAEVEVFADRCCWGLGWVGLRGHPFLRRTFPNTCIERFAQLVNSGRPGHGRRHAGERLQKDPFGRRWLQAKAKSHAVRAALQLPYDLVNSMPFERFHAGSDERNTRSFREVTGTR